MDWTQMDDEGVEIRKWPVCVGPNCDACCFVACLCLFDTLSDFILSSNRDPTSDSGRSCFSPRVSVPMRSVSICIPGARQPGRVEDLDSQGRCSRL